MSEEISNKNRKKVLVADDEKDLREALFTAIAAEGYEVFSASDGEEALQIALKEKPDLLLLDLVMPNMGGHGVLTKLREDEWGKHVPVIVLTALDDLPTLSATIEAGGLDYMVKSDWKLEDIVKKVREKLNA